MSRRAWARHLATTPDALPATTALRAELAAGTLPAVAAAAAAAHPDRTVVDVDGDTLTHGHLDTAVATAAGVLADRGVTPGATVVLTAAPSTRFVVGYLAVQRLGAAVVPVDPAQPAATRAAIAAAARARVTLDDAALTALCTGTPRRRMDPPGPARNNDVAVLAFTSGTTGDPKGVPLTHANLLASARAAMRAWHWQDGDVLSHALPLFHQHGLGGLHMTLLAGTTTRIRSRFDPADPVHQDSTVFFGVPAMWQRLLDQPGALAGMRRLRLAVSGSAPLPAATADRIAEHLGGYPLERYGLTESGLDVSNPYTGERIPGTVGFPLPGIELRLGAQDEIELRGPQVIGRYWDDANPAMFAPDGWLRTGDLGAQDGDGRVSIVGRLKELIITGGYNVVPGEVEAVLAAQPGVAEVAVAGLPSARWGEEVTAFVVPADPPPDPDVLLAAARAQLLPYKVPKTVRFVKALPRNALGKIQRTALTTQDRS